MSGERPLINLNYIETTELDWVLFCPLHARAARGND